jgi:hypothetical protein
MLGLNSEAARTEDAPFRCYTAGTSIITAAVALVTDPAMNLIQHLLMRCITHRGVNFMNKDILQTLTDRPDLVSCQRAITPVQKMLQPNAEICRAHWHDISTEVSEQEPSLAVFCPAPV